MSISGTTPSEPVTTSGRLISLKILMRFEPGTTRGVDTPRQHFSPQQLSIPHKPSDGRRRRHVLSFDIGAPKASEVYPLAIIFCITSCDRLTLKTIKPFKE